MAKLQTRFKNIYSLQVEEQATSALEERNKYKNLLDEMKNQEPVPVVQDNSQEIKMVKYNHGIRLNFFRFLSDASVFVHLRQIFTKCLVWHRKYLFCFSCQRP